MFRFTRYNPTVLNALAQLWHASCLSSGPIVFDDDTPDRLAGLIDNNMAQGWDVTLAWDEGILAGFLALKMSEHRLDQLFVAPDYQNKGLGLQLLNLAKSKLSNGFHLRTAVSNVGARRFYLRHGLRETGTENSSHRGTPVVYFTWP
jgi:GNAT superfamily N-acetyltransferase